MDIKIPEDLCKQSLEDAKLSDGFKQQAAAAAQTAQTLNDQARGVDLAWQSRIYRALDLQPMEGDMIHLHEGKLVRQGPVDPPAPPSQDPVPGQPG